MPDKYEREIEDILRNLKDTEPRTGYGYERRRPDPRRRRHTLQLNFPEWCLAIAIAAALFAGGWAYVDGGNLITGLIGLVGVVCIALAALSSFLISPRSSSTMRR